MQLPYSTALYRTLLTLLFTSLLGAGLRAPAYAAEVAPPTNRAGLVVVFEDGTVASRCVGFDAESVSGYDLLTRGEFAARTEVTSMGASVCSVDGQGCGDGEDCFCQCKSSTCVYWTYWQLLPDGWRYANAGAATLQVHDGDVQGWVWGASKPNAPAESAPPALTFADICNSDAVVYGISDGTSNSTDAPAVATQGNVNVTQPVMVILVIALPLLLGGAWWLLQRRKVVQKVEQP